MPVAAPRGALAALGLLLLLGTGTPPRAASAPLAQACPPWPTARVQVAPAGPRRLLVTLAADAAHGGPPLRALQFGAADNAAVEATGGPTGLWGGFTLALPPETLHTSFVLQRLADHGPATVPLTVIDACGAWTTVAGGDPAAFGPLAPAPALRPVVPAIAAGSPVAPSALGALASLPPAAGLLPATPTRVAVPSAASTSTSTAAPEESPIRSSPTPAQTVAAAIQVPPTPSFPPTRVMAQPAPLSASAVAAPLPPPSPAAPAPPADAGSVPSFSHVFTLVMENREYGAVIGNPAAPYLNGLAARYGLATQYYGVTHPSLPNYLALIGGSTFGVTSNCLDCHFNQPNLADQIEASGRTWKAYLEDMPAPCALPSSYPYAQQHNPFAYFDSIRTNAARCAAHVVPFTQLASDLATGALPHYVWITPNLCHSMHDCDVSTGDTWLSQVLPGILASPAFQENGVVFITWDEGTTSAGCCNGADGGRIVTLVLSPLGKPGFASAVPRTHYHLLRTIEDAWGLPPLGAAASSAPMSEFFAPLAACSPRPTVRITTMSSGDGRLRVTIAAGTNAGLPANLLQAVRFTRLANAVVEIGTQIGVTSTYAVAPPAPSLTLYVRRAVPDSAATVEATVRDGCGEWPTVFGGGPSAF
jgi:acid phosphatase